MNTPKEEPAISDRDQLLALARLVERMRAKREEYWLTRNPRVLTDAKKLEKHVDDAVKAILHPPEPAMWNKM